jgi:hypothetical protein
MRLVDRHKQRERPWKDGRGEVVSGKTTLDEACAIVHDQWQILGHGADFQLQQSAIVSWNSKSVLLLDVDTQSAVEEEVWFRWSNTSVKVSDRQTKM